jgi:hypothetical protein
MGNNAARWDDREVARLKEQQASLIKQLEVGGEGSGDVAGAGVKRIVPVVIHVTLEVFFP